MPRSADAPAAAATEVVTAKVTFSRGAADVPPGTAVMLSCANESAPVCRSFAKTASPADAAAGWSVRLPALASLPFFHAVRNAGRDLLRVRLRGGAGRDHAGGGDAGAALDDEHEDERGRHHEREGTRDHRDEHRAALAAAGTSATAAAAAVPLACSRPVACGP